MLNNVNDTVDSLWYVHKRQQDQSDEGVEIKQSNLIIHSLKSKWSERKSPSISSSVAYWTMKDAAVNRCKCAIVFIGKQALSQTSRAIFETV